MNKILFLADLHGNMPATLALEEEMKKIQPDEVWFLGDCVGKGPESHKTTDWVRANCNHFIGGNWDKACVEFSKNCPPGFESDVIYWNQLGNSLGTARCHALLTEGEYGSKTAAPISF